MPATPSGPFVVAALLCRKAELKDDGSLDILGIVDGVVVTPEPKSGDSLGLTPRATLNLTAIVSVRAGDVRGVHTLGLQGRFPSGEPGLAVARSVEFSDALPGASLIQPLELPVFDAGAYRFDASLDGALLTRIELHVRFA